ncbi:MAG TPA: NmrA family NAD(P)-binding protein [Anaerolineales bacterium]|nr:NmrA family NAD(P)-binding protein [Anaerolineales bacterium]HRQ92981.1 NmrA family NAD(P)-binding protein [Anaerolineales bacterium]
MILVTGANGKTGRAVLAALQAKGAVTRALVRGDQAPQASKVLRGDMTHQASMTTALHGADALYFIAPNVYPHEVELGAAWIAAAKAAGVRRFVYHSVLYPQIEAMPHHWQKLHVEEALIRSGLDFTILQPASYMQNLLPYLPAIRQHGEYRVPYSVEAIFSPVDLYDVAAAAARVLLQPGHHGAQYALAGPERLSSAQMAQQVSQHIGQPVAATQQPLAEWRAANNQLPAYARDTLAAMFTYYDAHGFAASSFTLESLLDRAPNSFREFLQRELS